MVSYIPSLLSRIDRWSGIFVALAFAIVVALPVRAQNYVEPTSPAGGSTAWPLNSSGNAQIKRGTLIIGEAGGNAKLCLNTNDPNDLTNCISNWSNAGSFVHLKNFVPGNGFPSTDLRAYEAADTGYARIQATGNNLYSVIVEANTGPSSSTALIATDGGRATNYAANFQGKLYIGYPSSLAEAKLCLNGEYAIDTTPGDASFGKGCITSWSQIAAIAAAGDYVILQPATSTPTAQFGQLAISGGASFASDPNTAVVIGAPGVGTPITVTCGDGICNSNECSLSTAPACGVGSADYCPTDCDRTPPGNITIHGTLYNSGTGSYPIAGFGWTLPTDPDLAGTRILRQLGTPPTSPSGPADLTVNISAPTDNWNDPTQLEFDTTYYYAFYAYDATGNFSSGQQMVFRVNRSTVPPFEP